jgi:hypothetical protein
LPQASFRLGGRWPDNGTQTGVPAKEGADEPGKSTKGNSRALRYGI